MGHLVCLWSVGLLPYKGQQQQQQPDMVDGPSAIGIHMLYIYKYLVYISFVFFDVYLEMPKVA